MNENKKNITVKKKIPGGLHKLFTSEKQTERANKVIEMTTAKLDWKTEKLNDSKSQPGVTPTFTISISDCLQTSGGNTWPFVHLLKLPSAHREITGCFVEDFWQHSISSPVERPVGF